MKKILTLACVLAVMLTFSGCRKTTEETTILSFVEKGEQVVSFVDKTNSNNDSSDNNIDNNNSIDDTDNVISNSSTDNNSSEDDIVLTEEELRYKPESLTVTLYDSQNSIYGFTYNTNEKPIKPVIQIKKSGTEKWNEYLFVSEKTLTFDADWESYYYYVSKATVKLDVNSTYIYRICDMGAEKKFGKYIGTEEVTLKTKNPKANSFTFIHVSDTQQGHVNFGNILSTVMSKADFLLHTGDFIQNPQEPEWKDMLDTNFMYFSSIPTMPISGNHEINAGFKNNDTFRHFNNKIPAQTSTSSGYFYSFVYGNAKFIMLNTNDLKNNQLTTEQYEWLVNELKSNTCKWTIVALHNPLYGVGEWGTKNNTIALALQEQLKGIFAQYGVDLVLQGHDHTIARSFPINAEGNPQTETVEKINGVEYSVNPKGVVYLTNGTSGKVTRNPEDYDKTLYKYATGSEVASWGEIVIDGDRLTVTVKHINGAKENVYYKWGIKKTS